MTVTAVVGKLGALAGKPRLIHEEVIDFLLLNPGASNKDIAKQFGMSYQWCLILTNSDGFQRRFEERKKELVDPVLRANLEDQMKGLVAQSIEVLMDKLQVTPDANIALKSLDIGSRALGYGAKPQVQVNQHNQSFVVQVPPKARNSSEWMEQHGPAGLPATNPAPISLPVEDAQVVENQAELFGNNPPGDDLLSLFARPTAEEPAPVGTTDKPGP